MEFSTLPVEFIVRKRPPGGTTYLFSWTHDVNKGTFYISNNRFVKADAVAILVSRGHLIFISNLSSGASCVFSFHNHDVICFFLWFECILNEFV